ncbi:DUF5916 domain-containing protein [candidate division KSB1 bacterium]
MIRRFLVLTCLILPVFSFGQNGKNGKWVRKTVTAVRASEEIKIDGLLNENIWQTDGYSDFRQMDPVDGAEPTEKTTVWVAYDDEALYVAGYMYDSEPHLISKRLGRRDIPIDSDWFTVGVDPYYDKLSGFYFCVNPSGSIAECALSNDVNRDWSWDCVWEREVKITDKGWIVEIRIPFDQLRFPEKKEYTWGIDFCRDILRKQEYLRYCWKPKEENGFVSKFADLKGIKNINPGKLLEFLPYSVGQAEFAPKEEGNPFRTGKDFLGNFGFDMKAGLKSNLTLDATINPDFGQVELDPAVVNLSAYETFYEEKRPFFIEGAGIFNFGFGGANDFWSFDWGMPNFFYSRRIGRAPQGGVSGEGFVNYPDRTSILGAAKITGKVGKGWNLGAISALTGKEYAEIDNSGIRTEEQVEPLANYNILRIQKEFNETRQGLGFIGTSLKRDLKTGSFKEMFNSGAYSFGVDGWTFLDKEKVWVFTGWLAGSRVTGSRENIAELQKSSLHYFQRPDADYLTYDENRTHLDGWAGRFTLHKQQGNIIFNTALGILSPGFNISNTGYFGGGADRINFHFGSGYSWFHPDKVFRNKYVLFATHRNYDFGGTKLTEGYYFISRGQFLNYWGYNTIVGRYTKSYNTIATRGGPTIVEPPFWFTRTSFSTDNRKKFVLESGVNIFELGDGGYQRAGFLSLRWKPKSSINLSVSPEFERTNVAFQYVTQVEDPTKEETFGKRYVFGELFQKTLYSTIRMDWTFTPKLTLQAYLQPFIANGDYTEFKEFAEPGTFNFDKYGDEKSTIKYEEGEYTVDPDGTGPAESFSFNNPDFNVKSVRGTIVLRWEYLPGSTLYAVWTQNRADYSNPGDYNFRRDFSDMWRAKGTNIFLIKMAHRLKF